MQVVILEPYTCPSVQLFLRRPPTSPPLATPPTDPPLPLSAPTPTPIQAESTFIDVPPNSAVEVLVTWSPAVPGSLSHTLRWRTAEGGRTIRLEARVQGTAVAPLAAPTPRPSGGGALGAPRNSFSTSLSTTAATPRGASGGGGGSSNGASRAQQVSAADCPPPGTAVTAAAAAVTGFSSQQEQAALHAASPAAATAATTGKARLPRNPPVPTSHRTLSLLRPVQTPVAQQRPPPAVSATGTVSGAVFGAVGADAHGGGGGGGDGFMGSPAASISSTALQSGTPNTAKRVSSSGGGGVPLGRSGSSGSFSRPESPLKHAPMDLRRMRSKDSKRELGLFAWMNSEVSAAAGSLSAQGSRAAPSGTAQGSGPDTHSLRRLVGEVAGKAHVHFKRDAWFGEMAAKVESKIQAGQLSLRDPVGRASGQGPRTGRMARSSLPLGVSAWGWDGAASQLRAHLMLRPFPPHWTLGTTISPVPPHWTLEVSWPPVALDGRTEHTLNDVRMQRQAVELLSSYHPFWLAIGVQTVLGQALPVSAGSLSGLIGGSPAVRDLVYGWAADVLFTDTQLESEYKHTTYKPRYWEMLSRRVLGRFLLLVLLLDRLACAGNLPALAPSLFRQEAAVKKSEQVLAEFLQPRILGAGDVAHMLRLMQYTLSYQQHVRDETDYRVACPSDLRDGTRIAKLFTCLLKQHRASTLPMLDATTRDVYSTRDATTRKLSDQNLPRVPGGLMSGIVTPASAAAADVATPDALMAALHFVRPGGGPLEEAQSRGNCTRLLRAMQHAGVNLKGVAAAGGGNLSSGMFTKDASGGADAAVKAVCEGIVRADQQCTLGLLWQMALQLKLKQIAEERTLVREVQRIRRAATTQAPPWSSQHLTPAQQLQQQRQQLQQQAVAEYAESDPDEHALLRYFNDPLAQSLLAWVRAVCAQYGLQVDNLTWSLADGRALCFLVHHYVPRLLRQEQIYSAPPPMDADAVERLLGGQQYVRQETLVKQGWSAVYEMGGVIHDEVVEQQHRLGVAGNFGLLHAAAAQLGIPSMMSPEDYLQDGPDELSAILFIALLSSSLLQLTREHRAAATIIDMLRRRLKWRPGGWGGSRESPEGDCFLRTRETIILLQRTVRARLARRQLQDIQSAALTLQRSWRAARCRAQLRNLTAAATAAQSLWRGAAQRRSHQGYLAAVVLVQRRARAFLERRRLTNAQVRSITAKHSAIVIQSAWRRYRSGLAEQIERAAITVQRLWRARCARTHQIQIRSAALAIQTAWRSSRCRTSHLHTLQASVLLQSAVRRRQAAKQFHKIQAAATCVQRLWRAAVAQRQLRVQRAAVVALQSALRARVVRRKVQQTVLAGIKIQTLWRSRQARAGHGCVVSAATCLQAALRGSAARRLLAVLRATAHAARVQPLATYAPSSPSSPPSVAASSDGKPPACPPPPCACSVSAGGWSRIAPTNNDSPPLSGSSPSSAAKPVRGRLKEKLQAVLAVQCAWRGVAARSAARRCAAALVLQSAWRARASRVEQGRRGRQAALVQALWRGRAVRGQLVQLRGCAVAVQRVVRGRLARAEFGRKRAAVAVLQALAIAQAAEAVRLHTLLTDAAVAVQCAWRARLARRLAAAALEQKRAEEERQRQEVERAAELARQEVERAAAQQRAEEELRRQEEEQAAERRRAEIERRRLEDERIAELQRQADERAAEQQRQEAIRIAELQQAEAERRRLEDERAVEQLRLEVERAAQQKRREEEQAAEQRRVEAERAAEQQRLEDERARQEAERVAEQLRREAKQADELRKAEEERRRQEAERAAEQRRLEEEQAAERKRLEDEQAAADARQRQLECEQAAIAEFMEVGRQYMRRFAAAARIQALVRGFNARKAFAPVWQRHVLQRDTTRAALCIQTAFRAARARDTLHAMQHAKLVITRAVPMLKARLQLLRLRRTHHARIAAAVVIQKHVRGWAARKACNTSIRAVVWFQALWRGHAVRSRCGKAQRAARIKIAQAAVAAQAAPHKQLGERCREALEILLGGRHVLQDSAVASIEMATRYSRPCCSLIASHGGVSALLRFMRNCNRSKPHEPLLHGALAILANICRYDDMLPVVMGADDCMTILSERLQFFRDTEVRRYSSQPWPSSPGWPTLGHPAHAVEIGRMPGVVKQWEGIEQILTRKMDMERKYLERLEVAKGSDVSARDATRKMLSASQQAIALQALITHTITIAEAHGVVVVHAPSVILAMQAAATAAAAAAAAGTLLFGSGGGGSISLSASSVLSTATYDHPVSRHHLPNSGASSAAPATYGGLHQQQQAAAAAQPSWQPRNVVVRDAYKELLVKQGAAKAAAAAAAAGAATAASAVSTASAAVLSTTAGQQQGGKPLAVAGIVKQLTQDRAYISGVGGGDGGKGIDQLGGRAVGVVCTAPVADGGSVVSVGGGGDVEMGEGGADGDL
ncbi:MAG: hypothetical protein WDW38_005985 [Sanguina aurantia]